jgi:hypothetical protein
MLETSQYACISVDKTLKETRFKLIKIQKTLEMCTSHALKQMI